MFTFEMDVSHSIFANLHQWWDFKELVHTPAARYRLYMVILMSFFGQWSGNNVVSYFMVSSEQCSSSKLGTNL